MKIQNFNRSSLQSTFYFVLLIICIGLIVPIFMNTVITSGAYIKSSALRINIIDDYLIALIWAAILGLSIFVWPVPNRDKKYLLWAWLGRLLVTLGFMLFYEAHYASLSGYSYFGSLGSGRYRRYLLGSAEVQFGIGSPVNFVKLIWVLKDMHLLPYSYHGIKIFFAMVGLVAIYLFYRAAVLLFGREDKRIFYFLAFFPSIMFWSSTFDKDPLVSLGIALYFYGVVGFYRFARLRYLAVIVFGILTSMFIRVWLGPIMIIPLGIFFLLKNKDIMSRIIFLVLTVLASKYVLNKYISDISTQYLVERVSSVSQWWATGGSANLTLGFSSLSDVLMFAPLGVFTALFRPLPGEVLNPFGLLSGLENLLLLWLVWLAINRTSWKTLKEPLVMWILTFIMTWAIPYGFVSYQNMGTAVRFKLMILPVLLILLLYLGQRKNTTISNPN